MKIITRQVPASQTPWEEAEGPQCHAVNNDEYDGCPWYCTRAVGHDGAHAAHYESCDTDATQMVGLAWTD